MSNLCFRTFRDCTVLLMNLIVPTSIYGVVGKCVLSKQKLSKFFALSLKSTFYAHIVFFFNFSSPQSLQYVRSDLSLTLHFFIHSNIIHPFCFLPIHRPIVPMEYMGNVYFALKNLVIKAERRILKVI